MTGASTEIRPGCLPAGDEPGEPATPGGENGTLLLAVLATATLGAARSASNAYPGVLLAQTLLAVAGPLSIVQARRIRPASARWWDRVLPLTVAAWVLWPLLTEAVLRSVGTGEAHELLMLVGLQNAALMLSVYSHRRRCQQVACLLGGFLVLFAVALEARPAVFVLAGLHGVLLLWWLMVRYWERIQHARSAVHVTSCPPVRWPVLGATVLAGLLAAAVFGSSGGATYVLRGVMPASGGDRWNDPFARAGVRDGDAIVAAKDDAMSFGPVESELFLESCMPTLYDMFNDLYGEPLKSQQKQDRSVSLEPDKVLQRDQRVAQTQRSGREFSILRRRTEAKLQVLDDRDAPAMLYVVGQVPVHLALESFDSAARGCIRTRRGHACQSLALSSFLHLSELRAMGHQLIPLALQHRNAGSPFVAVGLFIRHPDRIPRLQALQAGFLVFHENLGYVVDPQGMILLGDLHRDLRGRHLDHGPFHRLQIRGDLGRLRNPLRLVSQLPEIPFDLVFVNPHAELQLLGSVAGGNVIPIPPPANRQDRNHQCQQRDHRATHDRRTSASCYIHGSNSS
jgi:hypothetical protein